jgi:hypothetical protein
VAGAVCEHHSGFKSDIDNLKSDVKENKDTTKDICKKLDAIKTYIMGLFGSLALAILLLLIQMLNGS